MIEYICDNCGKRFRAREYIQLEIIYTQDDRGSVPVATGRKCDNCGIIIRSDSKNISY